MALGEVLLQDLLLYIETLRTPESSCIHSCEYFTIASIAWLLQLSIQSVLRILIFFFCWIFNNAQRLTSTIFFYGTGVAFSGSQFYSTPSFICRTTIPSSSVLFWYHGLHRKKSWSKRYASILDWSFSKMLLYPDIHPKFSFIWNITRRLFDNWRFFI